MMLTEEGKKATITKAHWPRNAAVLWDREARIDRVFGSGVPEDEKEEKGRTVTAPLQRRAAAVPVSWPTATSPSALIGPQHRFQLLPSFRFDPATKRWRHTAASGADGDPTPLSEQLQLTCVSYNVLDDRHPVGALHCATRWPLLLELLRSKDADVIALQEVTPRFLFLLVNEPWVRASYHVTDMQEAWPARHAEKLSPTVDPSGQVLLSKRPPSAVFYREQAYNKQLITAFHLPNGRVLCISNLHLTSDYHRVNTSLRQEQLNALADACPWAAPDGRLVDVLMMGDTNMVEREPIPADYIDCTEGGALTFDPQSNSLAASTSRSGRSARVDRMLMRMSVPSSSGAVWACTASEVIGREKVLDRTSDSELHLSDHFGIVCRFEFRTASLTENADLICRDPPVHTSAVVILPPASVCEPLQAIRERHDPAFRRWPPHINLLWGFVDEQRLDHASAVLRSVCARLAPFSISLGSLALFRHRQSSTVFASLDDPSGLVHHLQATLQAAFPLCNEQSGHAADGFHPHCTVAKVQSRPEQQMRQWAATAAAWSQQPFEVADVAILVRSGDQPFRVWDRIPLTAQGAAAVVDRGGPEVLRLSKYRVRLTPPQGWTRSTTKW